MQPVETYIQDSSHRELLSKLRTVIGGFSTLSEEYKWNMPVYTINGKDVCYLKDTNNGVNIGFTKAQQLTDSNQLLEGTGKDMRHIKVTSIDEYESKKEEIVSLIEQAIRLQY